ncbi:16S rRNA (guanine(527)-N(7))-methyltransferase RsmG [Anaeromicropila herbilytica]|uniref:Ribosomal RNA small subunit methyltransferase G n=1 Tax=Anaeromicropila herbilytica TaxID=2785025 RepID=A0A7R7IFE9_9FIRM|nr:16S rRNA (guanine(527)-N(7))-methyltransferase RsmG [Anaeromicropila herbilytica]BCN33021.1 ribosomal RNA small subunit methyltransferase G [Anaeromicropila herbilytica]
MRDTKTLINGLKEINITLTDKQISQLIEYYEILVERNKVMNLTAITDYEEVVTKHFIDSLSLVNAYDITKEMKVIDLGTGAGFPGIPLKIAFPNLEIVLVDSLNKRINFLNEVIEKLGLVNITAIHARAEELGRNKEHREKYDICVSRAVANLATLSEYCIPFVKINGAFISYKSGKMEEELESSKNAVQRLGGEVDRVYNFTLPETDMERSLIVIKKVKSTLNTYPRTAGKPSKEPIR